MGHVSSTLASPHFVTRVHLQEELDVWTQEHGDTYGSGIRPMFSLEKVRNYDSYWNWVIQDAAIMFEEIAGNRLGVASTEFEKQFYPILNRMNPRALDCIAYMVTDHMTRGRKTHRTKNSLEWILAACRTSLAQPPAFRTLPERAASCTVVDDRVDASYLDCSKDSYLTGPEKFELARDKSPLLGFHLKRRIQGTWKSCPRSTGLYQAVLDRIKGPGISFEGKCVLLTGAGCGSIGAEILRGLLSGGARVVVTTSSFSPAVTASFQKLYSRYGARGSRLVVVPFNQASKQDCESLIQYVVAAVDAKGLDWDIDHVIPLAAISENGREIDQIDSRSELAHRMMLTNTLRLLGAIKLWKEKRGFVNRPTQVLVPLSPNHGTFGHDGLYSESKISLETLFYRWHSESWSEHLSIMGIVIGWTRGTGLMASNDRVVDHMEREAGIRTFSTEEMATNILGLMAPPITSLCQEGPICADLSGGLSTVTNLRESLVRAQTSLEDKHSIRRALHAEHLTEEATRGRPTETRRTLIEPRSSPVLKFPQLPDYYADIEPASELKGMLDLDRVVGITGFAEIGPYGNSRTRWDMEVTGDFSTEGYVEMAWMMGLIRHYTSSATASNPYCGWVDSTTQEPIAEHKIKERYGEFIHQHCGIRAIEPGLANGYDPKRKKFLHEIVLERDLPPMEVPQAVAEEFKREHGEKVEVSASKVESGELTVRFKKGTVLMIPKAREFNRAVAGQIPSGWDARTYGISEEIVNQVDRSTLYTLVCTAEALLSCGVTDPYEFYQYVHASEIGNCIGSGLGGGSSLSKIHRDRFLDKVLPQDTLQETFINTAAAWINMLLLASSGPIKTPVGACATAVESLDLGYEMIVSRKAKLCFVGGFDDFSEEVSYEFGMMGATIDSDKEARRGRPPTEMSRPTSSSRDGFVESHGCGIQILTSARLALDAGLPIYGVLAFTGMASDKIGRSVPAPGKGIATFARESQTQIPSPLLSVSYRRQRLELRLKQVKELEESGIRHFSPAADSNQHISATPPSSRSPSASSVLSLQELDPYTSACIAQIIAEADQQAADARYTLGGNAFFHHLGSTASYHISPLRGALAVWNLTIDDLAFASCHGTSTRLNDLNESAVLQAQLSHLGRSRGNPIWGVFQKYLTGHPKGAAGAWMLNGALQAMDEGVVPGNRNADNIDRELEKHHLIAYPRRNVRVGAEGIKAFTLTSFGFGQKGAQAVVVHPRYLFAVLEGARSEYEAYAARRKARERKAQRCFGEGLIGHSIVKVKDKAPYEGTGEEMRVLLDGEARLGADGKWT